MATATAKLTGTAGYRMIADALWKTNPISKQVLGICSALAVTVQMNTAIVMGLAMTFVTALSSLAISAMRHVIPRNVRLAEAPSFGQAVLHYDKNSRGSMAYLALAGEVLRREAKQSHYVNA